MDPSWLAHSGRDEKISLQSSIVAGKESLPEAGTQAWSSVHSPAVSQSAKDQTEEQRKITEKQHTYTGSGQDAPATQMHKQENKNMEGLWETFQNKGK